MKIQNIAYIPLCDLFDNEELYLDFRAFLEGEYIGVVDVRIMILFEREDLCLILKKDAPYLEILMKKIMSLPDQTMILL